MNRRDIELLSAYLDGQLKPSDTTRLESRLKSDPELVAVMDDLRAARNLLRKLPQRRAPRNFTLTRKMVGENPPMPRAYPLFRFATTIATLLLFFSFGLNFLAPQMAAAPAFGMGGGGPGQDLFSSEQAQEPSIAAAPADAPAATEAPSAEMLPMPTQMSTLDAERSAASPTEKIDAAGNAVGSDQSQVENEVAVPVPLVWQFALAGIAVVGALLMLLLRQSAFQRWRQRE